MLLQPGSSASTRNVEKVIKNANVTDATDAEIIEHFYEEIKRFCCFNAVIIIVETVQTHTEEITYAEPKFYKRNTQKAVRSFITVICVLPFYIY